MDQEVSIESFNQVFSTEDDCRKYLYDVKWRNGYCCRRCQNTMLYKGRTSFHARCKRCGYDESVTAHTVFQCMKIPLRKAFGIILKLGSKQEGLSSIALAKEFSVNQKSSWLFKRKAQHAMHNSDKDPLSTTFRIDVYVKKIAIRQMRSSTYAGQEDGRKKTRRGKVAATTAIINHKGHNPLSMNRSQEHYLRKRNAIRE